MEQLTFELAPAEPPSFANFVAGRNAEAVTRFASWREAKARETVVLLWGAPDPGRTHLLRAAVAAAPTQPAATYHADPASASAEPPALDALVAVDDVDRADAEAQGRLFTLYNRLQRPAGSCSSRRRAPRAPALARRPAHAPRLGPRLRVVPLADADKPEALAQYARGARISAGATT